MVQHQILLRHMNIDFSVIIPAYNADKFIAEAISSALIQEGITLEVIVVNDGSTDKTLDIAQSFGDRIRIISQPNAGLASARNSGAKSAQGKLLAFLDADDIWLPGKLYSQMDKFQQGYKLAYTNRLNFGEIGDLPILQSEVTPMKEGDIWKDLLYANMISASSSVIAKQLFDEMGGFSAQLRSCEDWDLWLRCAEKNPIGYCSQPFLKYRMHAGGLSKDYRFMSKMRTVVLQRALSSERAKALSPLNKRKILSHRWSTSAWEAAKAKNISNSLLFYLRSLSYWPFDSKAWHDIVRLITGRV
jgi:glycosyltransferase involved in cell wall biosynthesis